MYCQYCYLLIAQQTLTLVQYVLPVLLIAQQTLVLVQYVLQVLLIAQQYAGSSTAVRVPDTINTLAEGGGRVASALAIYVRPTIIMPRVCCNPSTRGAERGHVKQTREGGQGPRP